MILKKTKSNCWLWVFISTTFVRHRGNVDKPTEDENNDVNSEDNTVNGDDNHDVNTHDNTVNTDDNHDVNTQDNTINTDEGTVDTDDSNAGTNNVADDTNGVHTEGEASVVDILKIMVSIKIL